MYSKQDQYFSKLHAMASVSIQKDKI